MTTAHVALYDVTDERDPYHWALWLRSADNEVILQIEDDKGGIGYYVAEPIYNRAPQNSTRCRQVIECGTVPEGFHDAAVDVIQGTPVDNNSTTWNCQAWIMEALQLCSDAGLFSWNDGAEAALQAERQNWQ